VDRAAVSMDIMIDLMRVLLLLLSSLLLVLLMAINYNQISAVAKIVAKEHV